jgi:hypothetical protein
MAKAIKRSAVLEEVWYSAGIITASAPCLRHTKGVTQVCPETAHLAARPLRPPF